MKKIILNHTRFFFDYLYFSFYFTAWARCVDTPEARAPRLSRNTGSPLTEVGKDPKKNTLLD